MPTFYCNYFLAWHSGAPYTRGPLDFAYPAYPIVTPLTQSIAGWRDARTENVIVLPPVHRSDRVLVASTAASYSPRTHFH